MGGFGVKRGIDKDLTEIEKNILSKVCREIIEQLESGWSEIMEVTPEFESLDTNPTANQTLAPNEPVALISFLVEFGEDSTYINFLNEPDVAYAIADFIGYSTPNQKAYEMLDDEVKNDGISYLDDDYIEEKTTVFCNLSDEANQKMQTLWTDMKSSEEQTPNKVIVPAFMSVCVIASLIILIRRYIKKKKDMF